MSIAPESCWQIRFLYDFWLSSKPWRMHWYWINISAAGNYNWTVRRSPSSSQWHFRQMLENYRTTSKMSFSLHLGVRDLFSTLKLMSTKCVLALILVLWKWQFSFCVTWGRNLKPECYCLLWKAAAALGLNQRAILQLSQWHFISSSRKLKWQLSCYYCFPDQGDR